MDRFDKGKYGKILAKADEYLRKHQGSDSSSSGADPSRGVKAEGEAEGGGYRAYLKKAKEFLHKKEADDQQQVDGTSGVQEDKKKQYMAIAAGLWHARKKHKKRQKKRRGEEGEEEEDEEEEESESESESEEDEDDDDEGDDDEEGGWFGKFIEGVSQMLGDD